MKAFILDCSTTMAWCFADETNEQADTILNLLKDTKAFVPNIWSLEVINVLRVGERKKRISIDQSNNFISLINTLPIEIDMGVNELPNRKILEISRKYLLSAYDASYLELAIRKGIPFSSFDKILCAAAKKAGIDLL